MKEGGGSVFDVRAKRKQVFILGYSRKKDLPKPIGKCSSDRETNIRSSKNKVKEKKNA